VLYPISPPWSIQKGNTYHPLFNPNQFIRYESKNVQPPADILNKLAYVLGTSVDYLISGDKSEKAKASLKNSELLQRFKEIDVLPEEEQGILLKVISAYIKDYRAKQAYAS